MYAHRTPMVPYNQWYYCPSPGMRPHCGCYLPGNWCSYKRNPSCTPCALFVSPSGLWQLTSAWTSLPPARDAMTGSLPTAKALSCPKTVCESPARVSTLRRVRVTLRSTYLKVASYRPKGALTRNFSTGIRSRESHRDVLWRAIVTCFLVGVGLPRPANGSRRIFERITTDLEDMP